MTTTIDLETGAAKLDSVHVPLDAGRGVRVQPIDITIGSELGATFEMLKLDAAKRLAASLGVELKELTEAQRNGANIRFDEPMRVKVAGCLEDVLEGWDSGFVTDAAGNEIAIDAQVGGEGKRTTARRLVIDLWSRKKVSWCMEIIKEATVLSGELEGNSQSGANGGGSTGPAILTEAVAVSTAEPEPSTDPSDPS